jgi:hypothetical protein
VVEEEFDALARRQLATLVLGDDTVLAATEAGLGAPLFQLLEDVLHARWAFRLEMTPRPAWTLFARTLAVAI